ncbi:MAG: PHP domain-containing protein [Candidatus Levyibacteriota bacterium]
MKYKIDLHTHSIISHDGGITADDYEKVLWHGKLNYIAVTDHNETRFARILHKKLGDKIIIGEEIATQHGEIIGLFLQETIPGGLSLEETVAAIKQQDGLVYIPHPYETFRKGMQHEGLQKIKKDISIVEVFNGRGRFRGKPNLASAFANENKLAKAASSDAHGIQGLGGTFSWIEEIPTKDNLAKLLANPILKTDYAPLYTFLFPLMNRIKNKIILPGAHIK